MARKIHELKPKAIALFEKGVSGAQAAKDLGLPSGTVRTWKREWFRIQNSKNEPMRKTA
jgi:transposase